MRLRDFPNGNSFITHDAVASLNFKMDTGDFQFVEYFSSYKASIKICVYVSRFIYCPNLKIIVLSEKIELMYVH